MALLHSLHGPFVSDVLPQVSPVVGQFPDGFASMQPTELSRHVDSTNQPNDHDQFEQGALYGVGQPYIAELFPSVDLSKVTEAELEGLSVTIGRASGVIEPDESVPLEGPRDVLARALEPLGDDGPWAVADFLNLVPPESVRHAVDSLHSLWHANQQGGQTDGVGILLASAARRHDYHLQGEDLGKRREVLRAVRAAYSSTVDNPSRQGAAWQWLGAGVVPPVADQKPAGIPPERDKYEATVSFSTDEVASIMAALALHDTENTSRIWVTRMLEGGAPREYVIGMLSGIGRTSLETGGNSDAFETEAVAFEEQGLTLAALVEHLSGEPPAWARTLKASS